MNPQAPRGRNRTVTGAGKGVYKRGEGLGIGPVGSGARPTQAQSSGKTRAGGKKSLLAILLAVLLGGGGGIGALTGLFGGGNTDYTQPQPQYSQQQSQHSSGQALDLSSFLGGINAGSTSTGWQTSANTGRLNTAVASGARAKRTQILGGGKDTVTIMVYMCGTDLESRSGMATADLQEMAAAELGKNVNVIVFTGGCKAWKNNIVSAQVNQIYQVKKGGLTCLSDNAGTAPMTDPNNLANFIQWCAKNFPANRNELIFWDHGGGSLTGYGYDEKYANAGSMPLSGIRTALDTACSKANLTFDMIGFDACLMATVENALMLTPYADYLIASEETEPGVGWYYTNWLTALSQNPSLSTLELGQKIVDDFVDVCAQKCRGQQTTLSVVDLAELEQTVPEQLQAFAASTSDLIQNQQYQKVSNARSGAREFATSSQIDQVDLTHLALQLGTKESKALANALLSAVKYNRTASNMTNAYGLSVYFPYRKSATVKTATAAYQAIGMDEDYLRCIQQFASMGASAQSVSYGNTNPLSALTGAGSASASPIDPTAIMNLLAGLMSDRSLAETDARAVTDYLSSHRFNGDALVWTKDSTGTPTLSLPEEQWQMVQELELNVWFDDGEGYIDLGLDNVYDFTEEGALRGEYDGSWLAIEDQPVAYYHLSTVDDGDSYSITGRVPVLLNGSRADLILVFDNAHPMGFVAGARYDYRNGETETIAKSLTALEAGDTIDFLCDYYSYAGEYQDSYFLGEPLTVTGELTVSNVEIDRSAVSALYRFTDCYQQHYWTPEM